MFPESKLVETSFTIRLMSKPDGIATPSLVRWLAISLGVLGPGDKRETGLQVLDALLKASFSKSKCVSIDDVIKETRIDRKTVEYHLTKLVRQRLVDHKRNCYSFMHDFNGHTSLKNYRGAVLEAISRSEEILKEIERRYSSNQD